MFFNNVKCIKNKKLLHEGEKDSEEQPGAPWTALQLKWDQQLPKSQSRTKISNQSSDWNTCRKWEFAHQGGFNF